MSKNVWVGSLSHCIKKIARSRQGDARDWSVNEVLALGVLLRYYNISYSYYDDQGGIS